uniref:Uncharacterized protein n=1 Tax=Anguilla anguilla TaxID=7936 RepID=A0A0E9S2K5_ANGAN
MQRIMSCRMRRHTASQSYPWELCLTNDAVIKKKKEKKDELRFCILEHSVTCCTRSPFD